MVKRPTSVTLIGWFLIVVHAMYLVMRIWYLNNPMLNEIEARIRNQNPVPIPLQYLIEYGGVLINMVSGVAILGGRNWGRLLYIGCSIFGFIFAFISGSALSAMPALSMIPGFILFIVFSVILFRPQANRYFSEGSSQNLWQVFSFQEIPIREMVGAVFYIVTGISLLAVCYMAFLKTEPTTPDFDAFVLVKVVMIGAFVFLALLFLLVALWLTRFYRWRYYTGIVLLCAAVSAVLTILFPIPETFWAAPPEAESYLPYRITDLASDYFTGSLCVLLLALAGGLLVWSGRKSGVDQRSDQSSLKGRTAQRSRSIENESIATENLQSLPGTQSGDIFSIRGASILEFTPESHAEKAGMRKGDVIIQYGSERDITIQKLSAMTAKKEADGAQVRVVFVRDDQQRSLVLPAGPLGVSLTNATVKISPRSK